MPISAPLESRTLFFITLQMSERKILETHHPIT